jgi:lipoyl(octanoyl) transferase
MSTMSACEVYWLGQEPYEAAWKLQQQLAEEIGSGQRPPTLLLLEHPHTYTFGRRGDAKNLLWGPEELTRRGIETFWVDRGGDVTYHGPGQLVGYPLIPLGKPDPQTGATAIVDYVGFLRKIETVLIWTLAGFGLAAGQIPGKTGVWIQPDVASRCIRCDPRLKQAPSKIASIGVKVDVRGVTRHGFALNVAPEMSYWDGIIPCGLEGVEMVSLADLLEPEPAMEVVIGRVSQVFGEVFGFEMIRKPQLFDSRSEIA